MPSEGIGSQVKNGFRSAAMILFAITTGALFFAGMAGVCFPKTVDPNSLLVRSPITGWVCLVISTVILIITTDRWVKILPGLVAYAILGDVIALTTGYYGKLPVPRSQALVILLFLIASTAVLLTFRQRTLRIIDRIALLIFLFCLAFGGIAEVSDKSLFIEYAAFGIGLGCLMLAWLYDYVQRHRASKHESHIHRALV